ncbi:hypothetical protein [Brevundimonas sp.]|uniref:hypothetical protein n=1 Tax=Brevundimonas sp. TaxID=1871086 RepID=UPI00286CCF5E|nr:hypothetical protein [Brevundimonas sp.]
MKPVFSFSDAIGAPFVLLRRRPLYLFVWGLMMMALVAAMYSLLIPLMASMVGSASGEEAFDTYLMESIRLQAAINGMNIVMYLVMLLTWTAAARATLAPHRGDRFLFLRLGMDEVRVAVTVVAVFIGWYIALLVLMLLGVGMGMALWSSSQATAVGVLIVYGLVVLALSIWGWLRVSLIAPASLILKRVAFVEGWALARGQMWKLFGLNLVVWLIYMVSLILIYALAGAILVGRFFGQGLQWPAQVESYADVQPLVEAMIVPALATLIPLSIVFGWCMALYAAPGVVAARQLLDGVPTIPVGPIPEDAPPVDALQPS